MFLNVRARRMVVNLRTAHTGEARFGLIGEDGRYLPGRTLEDCDPICGDYTAREATWKGDARIDNKGPVAIRARLRHTELFSIRFS